VNSGKKIQQGRDECPINTLSIQLFSFIRSTGLRHYRSALEIQERTSYSLYDSMILQAALDARCRVLYSEDMQDGFKFFDLTVKNPFR